MLYIHGVRSQFVDQFGKDAGRKNGRELNRTLLNLGKYASISVNVPIESPRQLFFVRVRPAGPSGRYLHENLTEARLSEL
jgi:hypothetical protein